MSTASAFHININCRDFDRSRSFYEALGYRCLFEPISLPLHPSIGQSLGLAEGLQANQMVLMGQGGEDLGLLIDLIEWQHADSFPVPSGNCAATGVGRIAITVANLSKVSSELLDLGCELLGPEHEDEIMRFCCVTDPDGTPIELIEFLQGEASRQQFLGAFRQISAELNSKS